MPLLIRFSDILRSRIELLNECFRKAIAEYGYKGEYRGVYPIKVNQHRYVVEEIVSYGKPYKYGLEAGSKPELLAVMAMLDTDGALVICNGYKDEEYIETALLASKLGHTVILVVEKPCELGADPRGVAEGRGQADARHPRQAVDARLGALGGLGRRPLEVRAVGARDGRGGAAAAATGGCSTAFQLLHFHLGSQISSIRSVKNALREAGRFFVELSQAGRAAQVHRRRRRAGRRLRRLADQLRRRR